MKLYLYEHCPFCIRPRIISAIKNISLKLIYLANDDEKQPIHFIKKKQVPFLLTDDKNFLIESIVICQYLNNFDQKPILSNEVSTTKKLIHLIYLLNSFSKSLVYPSFISHPLNKQDFPTEHSKNYFKQKKEKYIGCFKANLFFPESAIENTNNILKQLEQLVIFKHAKSDSPLSWG